jgi:hypothetical protein
MKQNTSFTCFGQWLPNILPSHLLRAAFLLCWFPTLKMEVIPSSETSIHIQTTRQYIPEDGNIHNYGCENLKSYIRSLYEKNI